VFDALINGVSLVSTLRTAVDAEVGRIGLPALIAQLESGRVAAAPAVATDTNAR
jgi:ABC-type transporter MlaC component